jgi:hypothetical protein
MPKVVRTAPSSGESSPAPNPRDCLSLEPPPRPRAKARILKVYPAPSRERVLSERSLPASRDGRGGARTSRVFAPAALAIQSHETQCARLPQALSLRVPG